MSRKTHTWRHRWGFSSPTPFVTTSCGIRVPAPRLFDQAHGRDGGSCLTCARADNARNWSAFSAMLLWVDAFPDYLSKDREWFMHVWGIEQSERYS